MAASALIAASHNVGAATPVAGTANLQFVSFSVPSSVRVRQETRSYASAARGNSFGCCGCAYAAEAQASNMMTASIFFISVYLVPFTSYFLLLTSYLQRRRNTLAPRASLPSDGMRSSTPDRRP